ncbi:MAG: GtrA family protein [Patescibacteria group bacterium]
MTITRKDIISALITGLTAGFIAWQILLFLKIEPLFGIPWVSLVVFIPVLWMIGVQFGYFLGRWLAFFNQFGKFATIGFTNAVVDFGTLNLLISISSITGGTTLSFFKAAAFLVASTHSYFWNKTWVFQTNGRTGASEIGKFFTINLLSLVINTIVFTAVLRLGTDNFGLSAVRWANISAIAGSAVALIFNFVGFRLLVFRR